MTWQTYFLMESSNPSTLLTRSAWDFFSLIFLFLGLIYLFAHLSVDLLPEDLELAHFQQVRQVQQGLHLGVVQNLLQADG